MNVNSTTELPPSLRFRRVGTTGSASVELHSSGWAGRTQLDAIERMGMTLPLPLLDHHALLDRRSSEKGGIVVIDTGGSLYADGVGNDHGIRGVHAGVPVHRDSRILGINSTLIPGGGVAAVGVGLGR